MLLKYITMLDIRPAREDDIQAITDIYNQAVLRTTGTFDIEPKTLTEQKEWFAERNKYFPILVATLGGEGEVVGWVSLSRWSDRSAYAGTAEISVYVHEKYRGKGYGRKLLSTIIEMGRKSGLHSIIARATKGNQTIVYLLESLDFTHVGTIKEVGKKFDKLLDVVILQLIY